MNLEETQNTYQGSLLAVISLMMFYWKSWPSRDWLGGAWRWGHTLPGNRLLLPCFCLGLLRESASLGALWAHPHWVAVAVACMLAAPALRICTSLPLCFQEDGVGQGASVGTVLLYCFGLCMAHGRCSVRICALMGLDLVPLPF